MVFTHHTIRPTIIWGTPKDDACKAAPINISSAPMYRQFLRPSQSPTKNTEMAPQKQPILREGQKDLKIEEPNLVTHS